MGSRMKKMKEIILAIFILGLLTLPGYAQFEEGKPTAADLATVLSLLVKDFPFQGEIREYIPGPNSEAPEDAPYTGLIILVNDLGYISSMSPKVMNSSGDIIFGLIDTDVETVLTVGIAGCVSSIEEARESCRAGERPLVVTGLEVTGEYPCQVVVSDEDAMLILLANSYYHFLERLKVVIVDDNL